MALENVQFTIEQEMEQRIERYWDLRSADFSKVRQQELASINAGLWQDIVEKHLPGRTPLKILDVGTGAGFFAILLAGRGHDVTGIDMSVGMLREAKKNMVSAGCRANFCRMNAQELDFPDRCFDAVISRNLTWTLPDVMQAYREWHRVLKKDGVLLNFDSDCGKTVFSKTGKQADVHATVSEELVEECNAIKDELRISTHRRPYWDMEFLASIGFDTEYDEDISSVVHQDTELHYDDIPMFGIYAKKQR